MSLLNCISFDFTANAAEEEKSNCYSANYDSVEIFEDGGKDYTYIIDGVENHCFVPPEGFNPLEASDEILERYGFPEKPESVESEEYNEWVALMKNYTGTPEPNLYVVERETDTTESLNIDTTLATTSQTSLNWSGYLSNLGSSSSSYYTQVQMDYTQPTISAIKSGITNLNSYWVGLGGYNTGKLVQAGTSTKGLSTHQAWYEYLSPTGKTVSMQYLSLDVSAGDKIHVYISFQKSNNLFNYYIANNTTGKGISGTITLSSSTQFDGTTAEWVVERCTVNKNYAGLGKYGSITLKNCKATLNTSNSWINLNSMTGLTKLRMINSSGTTLSMPGSISSNNQFDCTWKAYG
jgi:hypothetical protein